MFWNGGGADSSNPLENAKTSALGRAIAQTGLGLIGTGVASYEEVKNALKNREELSRREKEIKSLINNNPGLRKRLYSYLNFVKKKQGSNKISINDLTKTQYENLLIKLKHKKAN